MIKNRKYYTQGKYKARMWGVIKEIDTINVRVKHSELPEHVSYPRKDIEKWVADKTIFLDKAIAAIITITKAI